MRSSRAKHNMLAVSAYAAETAINTVQAMDLTLHADISDFIALVPRRETNVDEATGKEEADTVYNLGDTASLSLNFAKAQPQHFAFLYAFALGTVANAAAGTGYLHTITPLDDDLDGNRSNPSFTGGQRIGDEIAREQFASLFVNSVTSTFAKDAWCKVAAEILGTGLMNSSITEESITAAGNVTELTLAANAVAGASAAKRLDAIHQIRVELASGVWTEVEYSAVSDAEPAVITITAPDSEVDTHTYKVLYAPGEAAWMTFPSKVTETPLRVSEMTLVVGGKWNGTTFTGGRTLAAEINSIEHKLSNNGSIEFPPGASGAYGSRYYRDGRDQTLTLDREFRDYVIRNLMDNNEYFGVQILAEGAEYESGHKYGVELIFPRVNVLSRPLSVNGKRMGEVGDLKVLEDDAYGSVIVKVKNLQDAYAA